MSRDRPFGGRAFASSLFIIAFACVVASILVASVASQRVDCRRFVFAPTCRGVAAKRNTLEVVSGGEREDTEGVGKIVGLSESAVQGRSSEEDELPEDERAEDETEDEEEREDDGDEDGEEKRYKAVKRRRGGKNLGRSPKDNRRFGRVRKSGSSLNFISNRKVARVPSTYDWFSNEKRRRRNKGLRRRSEYRNYDY